MYKTSFNHHTTQLSPLDTLYEVAQFGFCRPWFSVALAWIAGESRESTVAARLTGQDASNHSVFAVDPRTTPVRVPLMTRFECYST